MNELVILKSVSKSYQGRYIISDVNLSISDHNCTGIIGANGSGKTTILNLIAKLLYPTSGVIHNRLVIEKGELGFSSGHSGFFPEFNWKKNIELIYKIKGIPYNKEELEYYIDMFGIDDSYNIPVSKYSTGMKQKLSIISAVIGSPKVVILDEPTNGLDIDAVIRLRALIKDLKKRISIIVTSHVLSELEEVCDSVHFIFNGVLSDTLNTKTLITEFGSLEMAYNSKKHGIKTN